MPGCHVSAWSVTKSCRLTVRLIAISASDMLCSAGPPSVAEPAVGITVKATGMSSVALDRTSVRSMRSRTNSGSRISYVG